MKTKELTDLGLTEDQAAQVLRLNGLDIEAHKARITALEGERDNLQTQLTAANDTLSKFQEIDPDPAKITETINRYKTDAENIRQEYEQKETRRAQTDWLTAKFDSMGVKSPFARKQLMADIMRAPNDGGLTWKPGKKEGDGKYAGFDEFMTDAKAQDPGLYQTAEEQAAEAAAAENAAADAEQAKNAPTFTDPVGDPPSDGGKTYTPPKIF